MLTARSTRKSMWFGATFLQGLMLAVLLLSSGAVVPPSFAAGSSAIDARVTQVLDTLAALPSLRMGDIDPLLAKMGFTPPVSADDWRTLAAREKLEIAYRHAAHANSGEEFLTALTSHIGTRYESVAFDRTLAQYFHDGGAALMTGAVHFELPPASAMHTPLPTNIRVALDSLSVYVVGGGPMGRATILRARFGLRSPEFEEALGKQDPKQFLHTAALLASPPPTLQERVSGLEGDFHRYFESHSTDSTLQNIAAKLDSLHGSPTSPELSAAHTPTVDDRGNLMIPGLEYSAGGLPPGGPGMTGGPDISSNATSPTATSGGGGGGGGSAARIAQAAERDAAFEAKYYATPGSRSFRAVRARAGGRGGVIAGAGVSAAPDLGRPKAISIELTDGVCRAGNPDASRGTVVVKTTNGQAFNYGNVRCDALIASRSLVYQPYRNVPVWKEGEALGLATIDLISTGSARVFPFFIPADLDVTRAGLRRRMLLHPALVDLDIGSSVAFLDLWPSAQSALARTAGEDPTVLAWLLDMRRSKTATWKWSDRPAQLSADGAQLKVRFSAGNSALSLRIFSKDDIKRERLNESCAASPGRTTEALKKQLCEFSDASTQTEFGKEASSYDAAAPALIRSIRDFARVDELMRVLAIFRWAASSGASFEGPDPVIVGPRPTSPDVLVIGMLDDYIAGGPDARAFEVDCRDFIARVKKARLQPAKSSMDSNLRELIMNALDQSVAKFDGGAGCQAESRTAPSP